MEMLTQVLQGFWLNESPSWAKPKLLHHLSCFFSHHSGIRILVIIFYSFHSLAIYYQMLKVFVVRNIYNFSPNIQILPLDQDHRRNHVIF